MSCCLSLLLLLAAVPAFSAEWIVIPAGERQVQAYLARPQAGEGKVAVVLIHEIFGLSDWVISVADRLAAAGYTALAPDLLSGMGPEGGRTPDFADQSALTRAVSGLPPAQVSADLRAVAAYAAALARISCPVYGFYGGNDGRINATLPATTEKMQAAGKVYEPVTYEKAGHGFLRAGAESGATEANRLAHDQAWTRWLDLLGRLTSSLPSAVEEASWGQTKSR
ncbi:MAG: dienelactone hydrolase family protein [Candidatus Latescibacteria bacterium]|nr:dienelactone hydrolase family protein [Candidatus Latescibacterota bacterium]